MKKPEKIGILLGLTGAFFWGLFPVLIREGVQVIPPLTYVMLASFCAIPAALIYAYVERTSFRSMQLRPACVPLLMITLLIVIIPYLLFFVGAQYTSGINASMLLLSEILFTYIFTSFIGEKHTSIKLYGALGIFFGALFILYNGSFNLNTGDILIFFSTITYPLGNFYSKRALHYVPISLIIATRFILGGVCFAALAYFFEPGTSWRQTFIDHWEIISFSGLILFGFSKLLWYESLKRLDITKAVMLAMTFPLFSIIFLIGFVGETVSLYQWLGIAIMMIGVYFTVRRPSTHIKKTKYAQ